MANTDPFITDSILELDTNIKNLEKERNESESLLDNLNIPRYSLEGKELILEERLYTYRKDIESTLIKLKKILTNYC